MNIIELVEWFEVSGYHDYEIRGRINAWRDGFLNDMEEEMLINEIEEYLEGGINL